MLIKSIPISNQTTNFRIVLTKNKHNTFHKIAYILRRHMMVDGLVVESLEF